jgi:hypothetical protein
MKYVVNTSIVKDQICQETILLTKDIIGGDVSVDTLYETISRTIADIQDFQFRQALIKLGWTPPTQEVGDEQSM